MKRLLALALLLGPALFARSAETIYFRAVMLPSNEVPPIDIQASGAATIRAHVVRDDNGQIADGSVDFLVDYAFPGAVTFTGLHIHNGAAGVNGPVTVNTGLSPTNPVVDAGGRGSIVRQAQVRATDAAALATLRGMVENPAGFYANLHTTDFPGGVIRGQLQRAEAHVFMGVMSPRNEVPALDLDASGVSHVLVLVTRDAAGAPTSAQMIFDTNYRFPGQVTFTGYHIHTGPAGVNGPVIFNTGIAAGAASVQSELSGVGNVNRPVEVNLAQPAQAQALAALLANPADLYINLHTTQFPGGAIRAQLRRTDRMTFDVTMLPSNEVPPITGLDASAPARYVAYTIRHEDGNVLAGVAEFDVNFRFPGETEFTGLHIHNGPAGVNGPISIESGVTRTNSVRTETGFGNIFRMVTVADATGVATLNSLIASPENHYINLHTTTNPGGVVRAQLAPANTARPAIAAVVSANLDRNSTTVAPGGLVTIFGTNLGKTTTDLSGWEGTRLPDLLNGVAVAVGGQRARLLYVSPTQINAVLPIDTPVGRQQAAVNNGNGPAEAAVTVAAVAPAIFFGPSGGIVLKNSDFSLVGSGNPGRAGDVLVVYATGLGPTTPAIEGASLAPASPAVVIAPVAVTIGGRDAEVISSVASPGFAGLYQVAVRVPAGVAAGNAPLVLRSGQAVSNTVNIAVQ